MTSMLLDRVDSLAADVAAGKIGCGSLWGGADVAIVTTRPLARRGGFYPDPQFVVTPHGHELSWLFESLRDAFAGVIDFQSKYEFFGRLADAADRAAATGSASELLQSVLAEARALVHEFTNGPNASDRAAQLPKERSSPPSYTELTLGERPEETFRRWWQDGRLPKGSVLARLTDDTPEDVTYPDGVGPDATPVARFLRHVICASPVGREELELWGVLVPSASGDGA